jgi:arylsulfatase A-like enzyme
VLIFAACCGLAAGLLEVGTRIVRRWIKPTDGLYLVSRHFVWLAPSTYLLLFLATGLFLATLTWLWPRPGGWLSRRLLVGCALTPALMVAGREIYPEAWFILGLGMASLLVPLLERRPIALRRGLLWSFPGLLGLVLVMAVSVFAGDWIKERREASRPLPPAGTPNVLLIVMDTVRADRLSVYGYRRATTPKLEQLAKRGIRFDKVRATAPWTLPSHASMFSGRWPHELGVEWNTPLPAKFPTLAEYLGTHGLATRGFAANTYYCSYDTGIDRGFAHFEDYELGLVAAARTAYAVDVAYRGVFQLAWNDGRPFDARPLLAFQDFVLGWGLDRDRISAHAINQKLVDWLARRREPMRPFFAFLNYCDAHEPYVSPTIAEHRFGLRPQGLADARVLYGWRDANKQELSLYYQTLARDAYDNCLFYLDGQLGELFEELERRGELDRTLVIVTSDHGEGLGEHDLFDHGESLYRTEIGAALMIVPPARNQFQGIVNEIVSLRNLPATIVELVGLAANSPFPGPSLSNLWRKSSPDPDAFTIDGVISELTGPNPTDPNKGRSPAKRGPLVSLAEGDFTYIRNEGDGSEELFNERDDPDELRDQSQVEAMQPVLKRFRERLSQLKARP